MSGQTCNYPGCGANAPWTDWVRCEAHNGKPLPVTAETITDKQIGDLHRAGEPRAYAAIFGLTPGIRRVARGLCAEILNARSEALL